MSDIQPGDLVVCINVSDADAPHPRRRAALARLRVGRHYRVLGTGMAPLGGAPSLRLAGVGNADINPLYKDLWREWRFRKLNDGADDAELIARIKSCKPERIKA